MRIVGSDLNHLFEIKHPTASSGVSGAWVRKTQAAYLQFSALLIVALFSFSALAESSYLDQAIHYTEVAIKSADGETVVHHAKMAKNQANAVCLITP